MAEKWNITFHGGKNKWNNIHSYSNTGSKADPSKALDKKSAKKIGVKLRELRSMWQQPGTDLYVANAYKKYSQILRFQGTVNEKGQHEFMEIFTQYNKKTNPGLVHPFQAIFGPDGNMYVSSQDTNLVTRYYGPGKKKRGQPMPLPQVLKGGNWMPGTFAPNCCEQAPNGLVTVRGIAFGPYGDLYVANEGNDEYPSTVKRFCGETGVFVCNLSDPSKYLRTAIHILFKGKKLFIGNSTKNNVLYCDTSKTKPEMKVFIPKGEAQLDKPSGLAFGDDGKFYVASREGKAINKYNYNKKLTSATFDDVFIKLKDNPEFIAQES